MVRALWCVLLTTPFAFSADWPQFRGPTGDGQYVGPQLPTAWGPDKSVAWKTTIPGKGWSSPIVWKGKVYLTSAVPQANDFSLRALCIDAATGKIDWDEQVFLQPGMSAPRIHNKNSHASPTPTTDGERIYVHFGHMGTAALDMKGKVVWSRTGIYTKPVHGNGGSPILVDGKLVFSCDGIDKQIVIALNAKTGEPAWELPRNAKPNRPFSFSTPTILEQDGKKLILSVGSDIVMAIDSADGKVVWQSKFGGYSVIPKPLVGHGLVFISTGYDSPELKAIKLGGSGDVTRTHAGWTEKKGAPHTPSMLLIGDELYTVSDKGVMTCWDAKTGTQVWQDRARGEYSASPIVADGKIYLTNEAGQGSVLQAGKKYNVLAESELGEKTFASPAAVDGALYIRTESKLYKFTEKK